MKPKTIIGLVLLAGFAFLVMRSFGEQVSGYMSFTEAAETGGRAHVVGEWVRAQPTTYDAQSNTFSFWMRDEDGAVREVRYANPKPANFEDATEVVIEGQMAGDHFAAEHILIKCPSKYNEGREFQDPDAHPEGVPMGRPATQPASL
ncbi:MAG: cytochrome c maturation protein CcmE [Rhodothermales bacterium]|nr:cytochrome c maturation protein CcmE [Rhodothermales bacterium]